MIVEYKCNNIECYVRNLGAVLDGLPKTTRREEESSICGNYKTKKRNRTQTEWISNFSAF